jgi:hypothetical protein
MDHRLAVLAGNRGTTTAIAAVPRAAFKNGNL